jgi:hypothetical protein
MKQSNVPFPRGKPGAPTVPVASRTYSLSTQLCERMKGAVTRSIRAILRMDGDACMIDVRMIVDCCLYMHVHDIYMSLIKGRANHFPIFQFHLTIVINFTCSCGVPSK